MKVGNLVLFWTSFVVVAAFTIPDNNLEQNLEQNLELAEKDCECENGRCVFDVRGKAKCNCFPRFALTDEKTCKPCDCGKNGKCIFLLHRQTDGSVEYEKKCICDKGSAEKGGKCIDCQCGENSQCEYEGDDKICYCLDGYTEKDGVCTECNCGEYGDCKFINGDKKCFCFEKFIEVNGKCKEKCILQCGDDPDIVCENDDGELENIICGCSDSKLIYVVNKKKCVEKCTVQCGDDPNILCQNDDGELENVICGCSDSKSAYNKDKRMCVACNCGEHSQGCSFEPSGGKTCQCDDGYGQRGDRCEVGCGTFRYCLNGGSCEKGLCLCNPGTVGDLCEVVENCKDLCPNDKETNCTYDIVRKKAYCKCLDGELGYDSEKQVCRRTCDNDKCENGGTCSVLGDSMFCKCLYGTSGDFCREVEGCLPGNNFCKDEAVCYFDVRRKEAACKCPDENKAYDKDNEKCKVPCDDNNRCKNRGECKGFDVKFCRCKEGTTGDLCERVPDCENTDFCGHDKDVKCIFDYYKDLKVACVCGDGSKKFDPTTKECKRTCDSRYDCYNGGHCIDRGGHNFCECLKGTSGDLCEIANDCENKIRCKDDAICEFDVKKLEVFCRCKDEGKRYESETERCKNTCEMLDDASTRSTCRNGGTCGKIVDSLFCKCLPGTSGDWCEIIDECKKLMCKDNSICIFDIKKEQAMCKCKYGKQYDPYSEKCRDTCGDGRVECYNGGKCGELNFCHCLPGTSGDICEIVDACDSNKNKCKGDALCVYDVKKQNAVCKCRHRDELYDTMNERCKRTCDNGNRKCSYGGKCDELSFCKCLPGTTGDLCDIIEGCTKDEDKCKGDSFCDYDVDKQEAVCRCKYKGELYNPWSQKCQKTCDESNSMCRNGGACDGTGDLKFCKCLPGTRGDLCDIVDECEKNPDKCKDGAECVFDSENQDAECRCKVDGEGYDPWNERCKKTCTSMNDCQNGGVCKVALRAKFCDCVPGTSGDICEGVDDCQTGIYKQCNGDDGTCKFDVAEKKAICECSGQKKFDDISGICRECDCGSYAVSCYFSNGEKTCSCSDGFAERNGTCEKTKCTEKSCYDGKCDVIDGQEVCSCFEGYALEEDNCTKLHCILTPCINGSCIVRHGNVEECVCGAGFTLVDDTCKRGICGPGYCYGGKCETMEGELVCVCPERFHLDGVGCYETQCIDQPCFGGKCDVIDQQEICTCKEGYVLENVVCKKILCVEKACFGGQCHLLDGKEECICPVGYTLYDDVCRADF